MSIYDVNAALDALNAATDKYALAIALAAARPVLIS